MTKSFKRIVPAIVLTELEGCGLPWTVEQGKKHHKLYIDGRFVDILPLTMTDPPRMNLKIRAHVRRFVRDLKEGRPHER